MSDLTPGRNLGERFTLLRRLGTGGMSEVWLIRDGELDQELVAKIVPPRSPADRIALLRRECRNARRLSHPNIVRVFDFHRFDDLAFITMEAVEGDDIGCLRGAGAETILRAAVPIAAALGHAHRLGVIHRDLKVSNVLLDGEQRPRLVDFGLSGLLAAADDDVRLTGGGSPYSVSPQQLAGEEPRASDDIYAFGVLLHELVTGRPPFWPDVTEKRVREEPAPSIDPAVPVPQRLRALVERMLSKTPEQRPPDMEAVKSELESIRSDLAAETIRLTPPPRASPIRPLKPTGPSGPTKRRPQRRRVWWTVLAIVVPALLAVEVLVLLPRWARSQRERRAAGVEVVAAPVAEPTTTTDAPPVRTLEDDARERARLRRSAEEEGGRAGELFRVVEAMGAADWGGGSFDAARERMADGDAHLGSDAWIDAGAVFRRAVELLEALEVRSGEVRLDALDAGRRALEEGDSASATAAFELASRIAPGDPDAERGLRRARVADELAERIDAGARLEREGRISRAEAEYTRAVELDPLSGRAREALERVRTRIASDAFARSMSEGLNAIEAGDYESARDALRAAAELRPGSPEVAEALAQAEESLKLDSIAANRARASRLEGEERWREAAERYAAVLEVDPSVTFAQNGRDRCRLRADLARRMEFHLTHPDRLSADAVLEEAYALLDEAREVEPAGPRHLEQSIRLERLLRTASSEVRVILESDDETEVSVHRLGNLGTFTRRELVLRPGSYTAVGRRRGYRDVRREFVVVAGEEPEPLVVRCEEEI